MKKTLVVIDEGLLEFLKQDAKKEHRTMSGQLCALLELCRSHGGYSEMAHKININDMEDTQPKADTATPAPAPTPTTSRRVGRPRKPGTVKIATKTIPGSYLFAVNKRTGKHLVVYAPDYSASAVYIKSSLETGTFERQDVQDDFTENHDSFTIQAAEGDDLQSLYGIYEDQEFYEGWLDLSHIGSPEAEDGQDEEEPGPVEEPKKQNLTINAFMDIKWDEVQPNMVRKLYDNFADTPEVKRAVRAYLKSLGDEEPGFLHGTADNITNEELLDVMQTLQQKLRKKESTKGRRK